MSTATSDVVSSRAEGGEPSATSRRPPGWWTTGLALAFVLLLVMFGHLKGAAFKQWETARLRSVVNAADGPPLAWVGAFTPAESLASKAAHADGPLRSTYEAANWETVRGLPVTAVIPIVILLQIAVGVGLLVWSRHVASDAGQSVLGAFAGLMFWSGAVEWGLKLTARQLGLATSFTVVDGRVLGAHGEMILIQHSWPFLLLVLGYLFFAEWNRCPVFLWFRRRLPLMREKLSTGRIENYGPRTAFQFVMVVWTFYVAVLWTFDPRSFPPTWHAGEIVFAACLGALPYLVWRLHRQPSTGAKVRYAIGTGLVAWNAVEIAAAWQWFEEPWTLPTPWTITLHVLGLAAATALLLRSSPECRSKIADGRLLATG